MRESLEMTLNGELAAVDWTENDRNTVLGRMRGERHAVRRKMTTGAVLVLLLVLLSVTVLAAGTIHFFFRRVAQMEADGDMLRWGLQEKRMFVSAMREAGMKVDEEDWAILEDSACSDEERNAAADRIVYARFGTAQEAQNAGRVQPSETVLGKAPDIVEIFCTQYFEVQPDAAYDDYLDALGYFLRDEYLPQLEMNLEDAQKTEVISSSVLTDIQMIEDMRNMMTEVYSWSYDAAQEARICAERMEDSTIWYVTGEVESAALEDSFEPVLQDDFMEQTKTGYRIAYYAARTEEGNLCRAGTLDELGDMIREKNRRYRLYTIYIDEAEQLALKAIQNRYDLSDAEIKRYFVYETDHYYNDPDCIRVGIVLRTRNNSIAPWDYAAIVNYTTAQVDDVFMLEERWDRLARLEEVHSQLTHEAFLDYMRWFTTWDPLGGAKNWPQEKREQAKALLERIQYH